MPATPHVIVIHGLGRTGFDMALLAKRLAKSFPQSRIHSFSYPSRSLSLDEATEKLGRYVDSITRDIPVSFVGHSLGGIVARNLDLSGVCTAPLHRLVTLGSPHGGATIARYLGRYSLARTVFGPVLSDLGSLNLSANPKQLEIGCIVGATGTRYGFLPVFGADNDGLVLAREASFSGQSDHITTFSFHGLMPFSMRLANLAGRFLETGRF
jgi:pimeloyl-ACP methyl ester carboxylesterase